MPALRCAAHPNEETYVRCARCDTPICVRCMVDTPVGKKCRDCSRPRTHLTESGPRDVIVGFLAALMFAVPAGWIIQQVFLVILAFPYGYAVGEVALRAGRRRRTPGMQLASGMAALIGTLLGAVVVIDPLAVLFIWSRALHPGNLLVTLIAVAVAVARVRFW
jgi:hypothetical protein